jgi:hypothetical protein
VRSEKLVRREESVEQEEESSQGAHLVSFAGPCHPQPHLRFDPS